MEDHEPSIYRFTGFSLDLATRRFLNGDEDVALRLKSSALLHSFACNGRRFVSGDELLSALWRKVTVTWDSQTEDLQEVRCELRRDAAVLLRTLARCSYLLQVSPLKVAARRFMMAEPLPGSGIGPSETMP